MGPPRSFAGACVCAFGFSVAIIPGCSAPPRAARQSPPLSASSVRYQARTLATGFTRPRHTPLPKLVIVHSVKSWQLLLAREALAAQLAAVPAPNFEREVALWITGRDDGGLDLEPRVSAVERAADTLTLTLVLTALPNAQALDVETRPWILMALAADAVADVKRVVVSVQGQTGAEIEHLR